jgi:folate-binding protein YgfZ
MKILGGMAGHLVAGEQRVRSSITGHYTDPNARGTSRFAAFERLEMVFYLLEGFTMPDPSVLRELEGVSGARFAIRFSSEVATDYGDPGREYAAVRDGVGLFDLSNTGKLRTTGRDRVRYLHNMLSNDIKALKPGSGCHAALLNRQGHIETDLYAHMLQEEIWLECPQLSVRHTCDTLTRFVVGDVVTIEDMTGEWCLLSLQGPLSLEKAGAAIHCELKGMSPLENRVVQGLSGRWLAVRRDRTGFGGCDIWLPPEDAPALWMKFVRDLRVQPVGYTALDWLRTEAGIPWYGVDMNENSLPMEFRLDSAISMRKGCYRGQEIVARIVHRGHLDRSFAGISVGSPSAPPAGAPVVAAGNRIGQVTSAAWSPALNRQLALAVIKSDCLAPGTQVSVLFQEETFPAEVVSLPVR